MIRTDSIVPRLLLLLALAAALSGLPRLVHAQEQSTEVAEEEGWIVVRPGDTLFSISRRYEVSVDELRQWNDLADSGIRAGMRLRIEPPPTEADQSEASDEGAIPDPASDSTAVATDSSGTSDSSSTSANPRPDPVEDRAAGSITSLGTGMVAVTLGSGETLYSLANRFALSPDSLSALNPGLPTALETGMLIIVPQDRVTRERTVRRGETLFGIARDEGITVDQLREVNDLSGSSLSVGQRLRIPASSIPEGGGLNLPKAGEFSIRPYPGVLSGRTLTDGQTFQSDAFQIGHPSLPAGSIVLVESKEGQHAFAEVVERAPARHPVYIEGSRTLFEALSLSAGDVVSLYRVH